MRKTTAEAFAQAYVAVDAQVTAAVEKLEEKKAELQAKAQAKCAAPALSPPDTAVATTTHTECMLQLPAATRLGLPVCVRSVSCMQAVV